MSDTPSLLPQRAPWSVEQARDWQARHPWLVGCNYTPAYATNPIEFWQAENFRPDEIAAELDLAQSLGFNSLRVYLHDLLWQDSAGLLTRLDTFLGMANQRGMGALLIFFDSCWHPHPHSGLQRPPERGVHNSGWSQSPGVTVLRDPEKFATMQPYVTGVAAHFKDDPRVHGWDIWNEPDNPNTNAYGSRDLGAKKGEIVYPYLAQTFDWVREMGVSQPVTCGVWQGAWTEEKITPFSRLQLDYSDVISFHWYGTLETLQPQIEPLRAYGRPLLCTEYMARPQGSTFAAILPYLKSEGIGAYNWGFVQGRTQTHLPWDSWQKPYHDSDPAVWFHEIFRSDHTPYRAEEVAVIRSLTQRA